MNGVDREGGLAYLCMFDDLFASLLLPFYCRYGVWMEG